MNETSALPDLFEWKKMMGQHTFYFYGHSFLLSSWIALNIFQVGKWAQETLMWVPTLSPAEFPVLQIPLFPIGHSQSRKVTSPVKSWVILCLTHDSTAESLFLTAHFSQTLLPFCSVSGVRELYSICHYCTVPLSKVLLWTSGAKDRGHPDQRTFCQESHSKRISMLSNRRQLCRRVEGP